MKNAINRIPIIGPLIRFMVKLIMLPKRYYDTQRKVSVLKGQMNQVMQVLGQQDPSGRLDIFGARINALDSQLADMEFDIRDRLQNLKSDVFSTRESLVDIKSDLSQHIASTVSQTAATQAQVSIAQQHVEQIAADVRVLSERQQANINALQGLARATRPAELPIHIGPQPAETVGLADLSDRYAALERYASNLDLSDPDVESDTLYAALELVLRGREDVITHRQSLYIESLAASMPDRSLPILDIGCGRGEFLGVLRKAGLHGIGVDINAQFVEQVREAGFEVHHGDANEYLASLEDGTLGGITAFQVIEHIGFDYLQDLLKIARTKLAPGGFILLETVNPYCLDTFKSFYLDPTHVRPVPKDLLAIAMVFYGFRNIQAHWQNPIAAQGEIDPAAHVLYYQTYAAIAYKP